MNAELLARHFGDILLLVASAAVARTLDRPRLRSKHKLAISAWATVAALGLCYNIQRGPAWIAPLALVAGFAAATMLQAAPAPPKSRF